MTIGKFLLILGICTLICWLAWLAVIFFINPSDGWTGILCFYVSLAFAFIGTFSFLGSLVRFVFKKEEIAQKQMKVASRQSILFTVLIIAALIFQSFRFLTWWNIIILILVVGFIEIFFISYKKFN